MSRKQSFWERCWKDKHDKQGIIQPANAPLVGWAVFTIASKLVPMGTVRTTTEFIAFGCLVVWASLEVVSGVSYFRRVLGVVVVLFSIYVRIILRSIVKSCY